MTPIFFLVFYFLGLLLAFVYRPIFGLYAYLFAFYMAPSYGWWRNEVPDLRYLMIAGVVAVLASLRVPDDPARLVWYKTRPAKLFIIFVVYNWLQIGWAIDTDAQYEAAFLFSKHLISFYLFYRFATSIESIKLIALIHVVGCGWFGYQALDAGGGRLEDIGGAVAGSNELGVHISTGLLFGGILLMSMKGIRRWLTFGLLPLIANCLVLTISRGAFLGFLSAGIAGFLVIPRRLATTYALYGILALVLVSMLAHDEFIERFSEMIGAFTTDEQELDRSAASRLEIAQAGIQIGLDHPFGAGATATERLSGNYLTVFDEGRAAHNTSAALFAENGVPGLVLYLLMIFWVFKTVFRARGVRQSAGEEMEQLGALATMTGTSLIAIYVSGNFSGNIEMETQYWCLALLASITDLRRRHLAGQHSPGSANVGRDAPTQSGCESASESPNVKNQLPGSRSV